MSSDYPSPPPSASSTSTSQCSHHLSSGRHFYVAVDRSTFKMVTHQFWMWISNLETLSDLLDAAGSRESPPIVLCCSSRDELDAVCAILGNLSYISLSYLYSDLSENERAATLEKFRRATIEWNQNVNVHSSDIYEANSEKKLNVIVITDACLPVIASGERPITARVLINFVLPAKKEIYLRRMATCLAADGIVINMVVGGEVVTLKHIEETGGFLVAEMPINISEVLEQSTMAAK